jgi:hypothetical protein
MIEDHLVCLAITSKLKELETIITVRNNAELKLTNKNTDIH